jgi:hypothetical protein
MTGKGKDHATAAKELKTVLGKREQAAIGERALRDLIAAKSDVEYGAGLVTAKNAETLVGRARSLVDIAIEIVRLRR